jgi:hypothetical protein
LFGVEIQIHTFPQVLNIFVFVVVHDVPFQKGVAQSNHDCNNPVAHVAHVAPSVPSVPSCPAAHVAHLIDAIEIKSNRVASPTYFH